MTAYIVSLHLDRVPVNVLFRAIGRALALRIKGSAPTRWRAARDLFGRVGHIISALSCRSPISKRVYRHRQVLEQHRVGSRRHWTRLPDLWKETIFMHLLIGWIV